jgi:hypothetical protein
LLIVNAPLVYKFTSKPPLHYKAVPKVTCDSSWIQLQCRSNNIVFIAGDVLGWALQAMLFLSIRCFRDASDSQVKR